MKTIDATRSLIERPFARVWAVFALLLIASTWRLWFPSQSLMTGSPPAYPSAPLFPLVQSIAAARLPMAEIVTSSLVVIGLVAAVLGTRRWCWWLVVAGLLISFMLDQHRLQPWAYQLAIYGMMFATLNQRSLRRWLIPMAASVYFYSALGKFDFQFTHTVGQDFLQTLTAALGGFAERMDIEQRSKLALLFPGLEMLLAIGILFRRTRPAAGLGVMAMHTSLIFVLGPWRLDHSLGVLVWNVALLFQAYRWFWIDARSIRPTDDKVPSKNQLDESESHPTPTDVHSVLPNSVAAPFVIGVVIFALIAPLGERSGWWDHWLSWSLYSPHTSRVDIQVHRTAVSEFDDSVAALFDPDNDGDGWQTLAMDRWSLQSRKVPIYPQARYQLAIASMFADRHDLGSEIRGRFQGVSDRWTGQRSENFLFNAADIDRARRQYWLSRP
ncbi:hypothetical protein K227x_64600 [Rubripirellula lacrimiformis]|uniref:Vitamin K-dependent gamma-carboxylase n=1 Tax=Rubripirellula lacrimiformis TaxID=1930273 RepID=A0A517NLM0_9BACT|nr:hypothetical protein [Rubripirellula lacrimiformis]QDT08030.1 hypothetical protein K227x_64600 [Rubripirellula lacrimiformis]